MGTPSITVAALLASSLYFVATFIQYLKLFSKIALSKPGVFTLSIPAILLHGYLLFRWIDHPFAQNLSLSHLFSLVCWLIALATLSTSRIKPMENLSLFIFPFAALSILLNLFFPDQNLLHTLQHPQSLIHILISLLTLGILGMAAMQATLLYLQNQLLRNKAALGIVKILPPLQTMETLLFQIIWSGFLLLSASLASAFLLTHELIANNRLQKIILSFLAWGLFAVLLYSHHHTGLRGQKAAQWTLAGVGLLIGAYLAGKMMSSGSPH
jgi:ABC-type uncharacterized transport system permease subunit